MGPSKKKHSLSLGRPPTAAKPKSSISSKKTQKTIVDFHNLNKALNAAKAKGDAALVTALETRLQEAGGLEAYQAASIQGQSTSRGGDSSIVLTKWLQALPETQPPFPKPSLLEIGALSPKNAVSTSLLFSQITRIDLHSQHPAIQQQDFMLRPLPSSDSERFDIISLSLVLNFVPTAKERGDMLRRTTRFLRPPSEDGGSSSLFLVLPAPCVTNSRYFNDEQLALVMASLGYALLRRKQTAKLVYYLWHWRDKPAEQRWQSFGKVKVRDGGTMNNFHVVLEP